MYVCIRIHAVPTHASGKGVKRGGGILQLQRALLNIRVCGSLAILAAAVTGALPIHKYVCVEAAELSFMIHIPVHIHVHTCTYVYP